MASLLGTPVPFEFRGTVYYLKTPRPILAEQNFIVWVQAEHYRVIIPHEKLLGPAKLREMISRWQADCAPGGRLSSFTDELVQDALFSVDGVKEMALIQFRLGAREAAEQGLSQGAKIDTQSQGQMTREILDQIDDDPVKGRELLQIILNIASVDKVGEPETDKAGEAGPLVLTPQTPPGV